MKIHIVGGSGSGKTTLAKQLAETYGLSHVDLDEFQWDNSGSYGVRRPEEERNALLAAAVSEENWVNEGVYYAWVEPSFQKADLIVFLKTPLWLCRFRVIRRFFRRKLGKESGKKESLSSLRALLRWMGRYKKINEKEIGTLLENYGGKVVVIKSGDPFSLVKERLSC